MSLPIPLLSEKTSPLACPLPPILEQEGYLSISTKSRWMPAFRYRKLDLPSTLMALESCRYLADNADAVRFQIFTFIHAVLYESIGVRA
jgi:hypothetical protein